MRTSKLSTLFFQLLRKACRCWKFKLAAAIAAPSTLAALYFANQQGNSMLLVYILGHIAAFAILAVIITSFNCEVDRSLPSS